MNDPGGVGGLLESPVDFGVSSKDVQLPTPAIFKNFIQWANFAGRCPSENSKIAEIQKKDGQQQAPKKIYLE